MENQKIMKFKDVDALMEYKTKLNRFEKGELAYLEDVNEYAMFDGEEWKSIKDVEIDDQQLKLTMYDLNKTVMASLPTIEDFTQPIKTINALTENINTNYFMLLCREISYYTLFQKNAENKEFENLGDAVIECLKNVGQLLSVEYVVAEENEPGAIEIWVRLTNGDNVCMYLFDAQSLIVTYGG